MGQSAAHVSWGAIVGGVLSILLGLYLSMYQLLSGWVGDSFSQAIVAYSSPAFLGWLQLLGILIAVRGVYLIATSFVRPSTLLGLVAFMGDQVLSALTIPLLLWLRENVALLPVVSIRDGQMQVTAPQGNMAGILHWTLNVLIALIVLGIAVSVIKLLVGQGTGGTASSPSS